MKNPPARRVLVSVALAATIALLPLTATVAQAQAGLGKTAGLSVPISGTAVDSTDAASTVQAVAGTFTIQRFSRNQGQIFAEGTVVATVTNSLTGATRTFVTPVSIPVVMPAAASGAAVAALATCDVLNLVLGPLHLDLLGLVVDLNQVVLNITGQTGAGNLLGNLICAITGLLDGGLGGALGQIVTLLNQLLAILS
jgi:hypothetical protein